MDKILKDIIDIEADPTRFNDEQMTLVAWASKEVKDRDGEIIKASGWELDNFRNNSVLMAFHDYNAFPVGRVQWIKKYPEENPIGLKFKAQFADTEVGREAYQLYKGGYMNCFSVGFRPIEKPYYDKTLEARVFPKNELLEISIVPIPALPDAKVESIGDIIKTKEFKTSFDNLITKPDKRGWDETDASFRYRVYPPSDFQEGTFRTVPIKRDKPRVSSVMGKKKNEDTMSIQALIFPKEDDWTLEKAKSWLDDHEDLKKDLDIFDVLLLSFDMIKTKEIIDASEYGHEDIMNELDDDIELDSEIEIEDAIEIEI